MLNVNVGVDHVVKYSVTKFDPKSSTNVARLLANQVWTTDDIRRACNDSKRKTNISYWTKVC